MIYAGSKVIPDVMVNMELWIPPQLDTMSLLNKYNVKEVGSIAPPGRFGWFVPESLAKPEDNWQILTKLDSASRFVLDDDNSEMIKSSLINPKTNEFYCELDFCQNGMYIPKQCEDKIKNCATLLAENPDVTSFVKSHIDQLKLYVKVAWVGPNLKNLTKQLTKSVENISNTSNKAIIILHWTPSKIIPNEREFVSIEFPRCGTKSDNFGCEYESNKLIKLVWDHLEIIAKFAYDAIKKATFTRTMYEDLINRYRSQSDEEIVACDWLRDNLKYALTWKPKSETMNSLIIGGIFPMTGDFYSAKSIVISARMAREAINSNKSVLRDYNLELRAGDGQCKSDMVMKTYIDYIIHNIYEKLIGIVGPACSETVEPLIGVSKHYKSVIVSYGAEGSSFSDRSRYPYFFRTIGENRQYKYVYLDLFKQFGWNRIAALTADGEKYTEYLSYMHDLLRDNGISLIANIKFPKERELDVIAKYLHDLKQKRARIIIADVNDQVARQVLCEAYKLEMSAEQGYVWFLPLWLHPDWYDADLYNKNSSSKIPCTKAEMKKAIDGHFAISHAYYAPDNDLMQEGITVKEWRQKYEERCSSLNQQVSAYAGYTYDAMWTLALGMDRLLQENQSYVFDLHSDHTATRLTDIISQTDFYGVSGHIKFIGGPSRYSVINVVQRISDEFHDVGKFYPNVTEKRNAGGQLILNMSAIVWLSKSMPDDGSEPPTKCVLSGFAELLDVSCEGAIITANVIGFGFLGIILVIGFIIVKRKYDKKMQLQEKYMKSLGIDLLQPDSSGFDKWEIPRDKVVINRKIGEGAFGTVYGGEAFFTEKGWLAVAVKTLKVGSSTDEKLDFLSEVEVMKRFEHKNIIKLLAVCIKCEPVLTVMEFMLYGDLKTYLLARRHLVNDQSYEDSDEISNKKLTAMALDVARALSYLAELKYVHRDIASRNCLINAQRIVKLGDFGMTRPMYENDYYKFNRKGMLPVRWMAPESLGLGIFTPASDVWSYGVLLYEIITFGSFPFQGMSNNQVLDHVKAGNSLAIPKGLKPQLEGLIRSCWTVDHTKRPTAPEIVEFLATNPRLLFPCLDVPLSSVQLEPTGQMAMQLPLDGPKFSFPLPWPQQNSNSILKFLQTSPSLLDLNNSNDANEANDLNGVSNSKKHELESTKPLLNQSSRYRDKISDDTKTASRYVNIQPGVTHCFKNSSNNITGDIQMNERRPEASISSDFNAISLL
ncbi:uncharacterized protein LOC117167784 isoform X3 [Belonocnema kinseyi]|nr:uncharacterized protein LOC117167784 isoform X3 [Belonocnema kinseyi]